MPGPDVIAQLGIDPQKLGLELGTGAVIGGIIGFAAKKVAKLIAVIVGLELALFKFLESRDILTVNWDKLGATFMSASDAATAEAPPTWVETILSTLSVSAGFTGGFFLGFKRG
ncbi:FUN14 domain-containing protein [Halobaculum sp. EA56]|uniref:FUN14 domain-containing protein n=1 Tax=Halobaculum sp. EA56 TaxID=3421648 RepID=UPI003EBD4A58